MLALPRPTSSFLEFVVAIQQLALHSPADSSGKVNLALDGATCTTPEAGGAGGGGGGGGRVKEREEVKYWRSNWGCQKSEVWEFSQEAQEANMAIKNHHTGAEEFKL